MTDDLSEIDREWNEIDLETAADMEVEFLDDDDLEMMPDSEL